MYHLKLILAIVLSPFSAIYWLITSARNWCYDTGIFKSTSFDIPIVSVGNLAVGGSGKTPMVEYLIRELQDTYTIAVLSRGYGRKTKGFLWVQVEQTPTQTGDEPLQIKSKFENIAVAVCEKRVIGVQQILAERPEVNLIILDDAFQHRAIQPTTQLLLSTYNNPFYKDWLMPSGRLRESRKGAKRADAIVFTKAKEDEPLKDFKNTFNKPTFYTKVEVEPLGSIETLQKSIYGFSALADNSAFENNLRSDYNLTGFKGFRDHYPFSQSDIDTLLVKANGALLVCTEKDWMKIKHLKNVEDFQFISIRQTFFNNDFINWLIEQLP
ncbi:MAG: tetraacyldisaccharide 4'-kinase [Bacteroidetes bacterium]|nr:MAG: tetraacyldisaccharide 4'-kinase [Bacteroidota bacterium]